MTCEGSAPDDEQFDDDILVTVETLETSEGSVWTFSGVSDEERPRLIIFGVDHRLARDLAQGLYDDDESPRAHVAPWQVLGARYVDV